MDKSARHSELSASAVSGYERPERTDEAPPSEDSARYRLVDIWGEEPRFDARPNPGPLDPALNTPVVAGSGRLNSWIQRLLG